LSLVRVAAHGIISRVVGTKSNPTKSIVIMSSAALLLLY